MCAEFDLVTRPLSGDSIPAITFMSVLLPQPFRPTMPIRSPSDIPIETLFNSALISKALETSSMFTTLRATVGERTFEAWLSLTANTHLNSIEMTH